MIEIKNCPSNLQEGFCSYSPQALRNLFLGDRVDPMLDFNMDSLKKNDEILSAMNRISVSGVQEKFPALIRNGKIKLAAENERSTHILKPAPWDETLYDRKEIPANEHVTMQIASQVYGILTAHNGLCFTPRRHPVYITRRFDILPDGTKMPMEDFASLINKNELNGGVNFKYDSSYEEIATAIHRNVSASKVDLERFFKLIVFNYVYGNGDAHLKNFSLILQGQDYRLAPAYDLLNTELHVRSEDFGLSHGFAVSFDKSEIYEKSSHPCRKDFETFGLRIGLNKTRINKILDEFMFVPPKAIWLLSHSYLNPKSKRIYLRIINERVSRFIKN